MTLKQKSMERGKVRTTTTQEMVSSTTPISPSRVSRMWPEGRIGALLIWQRRYWQDNIDIETLGSLYHGLPFQNKLFREVEAFSENVSENVNVKIHKGLINQIYLLCRTQCSPSGRLSRSSWWWPQCPVWGSWWGSAQGAWSNMILICYNPNIIMHLVTDPPQNAMLFRFMTYYYQYKILYTFCCFVEINWKAIWWVL